jgi:hypothetical protein
MRPTGALLLLLLACAHKGGPWEKFERVKDLPSDGERLVLLDDMEVRFDLDPKTGRAFADETAHMRVQALKPHALPRSITRAFDHTFLARPTIRGRVIFPDGTEQELDQEKQWESPRWSGGILYDDDRLLYQPVPLAPKNGVLEYEIKQRATDLKPLQFSSKMEDDDAVVLSRFTVIIPSTWEIEWIAQALGHRIELEPAIDISTPGFKRYVWQRQNVDAHPSEPYGVSPWLELPVVSVRLKKWEDQGKSQTAFASPKELSAWLWEQTHALAEADESMKKTVSEVLAGAPEDPREKSRRLYEYACERVQYCAIEIGYGSWFPHPANAVHQNKYGDCKDKANYLKSLLALAGVQSHSTLIYSHDGFPLAFGLPSLAANFNHAILQIELPQGPLLVDPTARTVAFGDLPISDREAQVLPIVEGGAELAVAPAAEPSDNMEITHLDLTLNADGSASGEFSLTATGAMGASLRQRLIASVPSKHPEVISEWIDVRAAKVDKVTKTSGLALEPQIAVAGSIEAPNVLLGDQPLRALRLPGLLSDWLPAPAKSERRAPLVLRYRWNRKALVKLALPAGVTVKSAPAAVVQSNKWFDYRLSFRIEGRTLIADREAVLHMRIIPADELPALRSALTAMHLAENVPVVLGWP